MIIIPEQKVRLQQETIKLKQELHEINDYRDARDTTGLDVIHVNIPIDYFVDSRFMMCQKKLEEISYVLETSKDLKEVPTDQIGIGTNFLFQFSDEDEIGDFTLVDNAIGLKSTEGFISKDSPFGEKVFGKKDGDEIEGIGTVIAIKKDRSDYGHIHEKIEIKPSEPISSFQKMKKR